MALLPVLPEARRDKRVRDFLLPTRVLWTSGVGVQNAEALLQNDDSICRLSPIPNAGDNAGGEPCAALLLDFGRELHGGVRFDIPATDTGRPVRVRVRFGESVTEAMTTPNNDHAVHDHEILLPWMGHTEVGLTGFRFVRVDLLDTGGCDLRSICAVSLMRDVPYLGRFECSDARLNAVWKTGARTVHLCMQDLVWDGIKRDRLVWIGDLHPEAMVIAAVFGCHSLVPETLDYQKNRTPLDAPNSGGPTGGGAWMNGISSYSLWWIIIQWDWYYLSGDLNYLKAQKPYLVGLVARLENFVGPDGAEHLNGFRFLEWPTSGDKNAVDAGLQALVTWAFQKAAQIFRALGETEAAENAARLAAKTGAVNRETTSKQAVALAVLAQTTNAETANVAVLSRDPFRGLSTFYGYYVLLARAQAGDTSGCLDLMRTYWGAMIERGATTFWEGFELDWLQNSGRIDQLTPPGLRDLHADFGGWCYQGLRHSLCSVSHTRRSDGSVETVCELPNGIMRL